MVQIDNCHAQSSFVTSFGFSGSALSSNPSGSLLDALQANQAFPSPLEKFARIVEGVLVNPATPGAAALGDRLHTLPVLSESGAPIVRSVYKQTLKYYWRAREARGKPLKNSYSWMQWRLSMLL
jgi:hypothetical protein